MIQLIININSFYLHKLSLTLKYILNQSINPLTRIHSHTKIDQSKNLTKFNFI